MNAHAAISDVSETNMTSKGQVLIPKVLRDRAGLTPSAPVLVGMNDRGEVVVRPAASPAETPDERRARIMAALEEARRLHGTGRTTEEIMWELRGDEPLP